MHKIINKVWSAHKDRPPTDLPICRLVNPPTAIKLGTSYGYNILLCRTCALPGMYKTVDVGAHYAVRFVFYFFFLFFFYENAISRPRRRSVGA